MFAWRDDVGFAARGGAGVVAENPDARWDVGSADDLLFDATGDTLGWCHSAEMLARLQWDTLGGNASLDLLARLERVHRIAGAAVALGLAAVERAGAAECSTGLSAGAWLAHTSRGFGGETAALLHIGRLLERFEHLRAAVLSGELSLEHVRFLAGVCDPGVLDALVALDEELTAAALSKPMQQWRRHVQVLVEQIRTQAAAEHTPEGDTQPGDPGGPNPAGATGPADATETNESSDASDPADSSGLTDATDATDPTDSSGPADATDATGPTDSSALADGADASDAGELFAEPAAGDTSGRSADAASESSWASLRTTADGAEVLHCELHGEMAEVLRQALTAETTRQRRAAWREHRERTDIDTMALLCRRHHGTAHTRQWTLQPAGPYPGDNQPDSPQRGRPPHGQHYEWHDHHTGHTTPAQQRGLQ